MWFTILMIVGRRTERWLMRKRKRDEPTRKSLSVHVNGRGKGLKSKGGVRMSSCRKGG